MKQILFIDPLEKLNIKKDSTLMLAATMKQMQIEVVLLFEQDFYFSNYANGGLLVYDFDVQFAEDGFYLKSFAKTQAKKIQLKAQDIFHMRIDPPFDARYLRYLWMLRSFQQVGVKVINSPDGILKFNEKLHAYSQKSSLPSFVGASVSEFENFCRSLSTNYQDLILKPLDMFQGMGVEKLSLQDTNLLSRFSEKIIECGGPVVAQPFYNAVKDGEIRSIYFLGSELASILKVPREGEFLANIAQGASFSPVQLSSSVKSDCDQIAKDLNAEGVPWVAFDIMGSHVSEINITCPGLLVEVSYAVKRNLAKEIIHAITS